MNKLSEKDHCDKLVILTAKIIKQQLTPLEQKEVVKKINPTENKDNKDKDVKDKDVKDKDVKDNNNKKVLKLDSQKKDIDVDEDLNEEYYRDMRSLSKSFEFYLDNVK
jgi:hypothetical protein